jgi:tRNA pseudouridine38-40 synthase
MARYKLTIEYDGTPYIGWQIQGEGRSVQGRLAEAVESFSGEDFVPRGAGRTDAGVHALGQVAHIDLSRDWPADTVREALNAHLRPDPIVVLAAEQVGEDFDARFSATARRYLYRIVNRRARPALDRDRAWHVIRPLDADLMHEAARALLGRHDFTTFRSAQCQARSALKTLDALSVSRVGEEVHITASARSFLHHQVRSIVGSLKLVGEGRWRVRDMADALEARDRARCGALAPARGLYLVRVEYGTGRAEDGCLPADPDE